MQLGAAIPGLGPTGKIAYNLCFNDRFNNAWTTTDNTTTGNTAPVTVCPTLGHKEVFVEIDSMTGQQPSVASIKKVIRAFGNAPVANTAVPIGIPGYTTTSGIILHVVLDETTLPVSSNLNVWTDPCQSGGTPTSTSSCGDQRHP